MENKTISVSKLMETSGVQFGTSGVRGRVVDMTDEVCWVYTTGFLQHLSASGELTAGSIVGIAGDLRDSTTRIMNVVSQAVSDMGFKPVNYGNIPSPAIALYGLHLTCPTIMVTGSHIPEDRNGIKFNKADGEILKTDEQQITAQVVEIPAEKFLKTGNLKMAATLTEVDNSAKQHYIQRFIHFFPKNCLQGKRIGLYEHSSVARDCLKTILTELGAEVTSLARSDTFVAVDTEAIRAEDIVLAKQWATEYQFDCLISTDGDGDRPLVGDENGVWLRGDIAGILCAYYFNADAVVTPVSSNSALELSGLFKKTVRTKIGSPFVVAAMQQAVETASCVVGYEANGGFLSASDIHNEQACLSALPTRDAAIVPLAILMLAKDKQTSVSKLLDLLPQRYTASDRLKAFPTELSKKILADLIAADTESNLAKIESLFGHLAGKPIAIDSTDGVRISFENGNIVHLRASGNAPELRCYNEADNEETATTLNQACMQLMRSWQL